jgi:hypothetical protein
MAGDLLTMFSTNQATWDRVLRIVIGFGMLAAGGMGLFPEPWGMTLIVLSFYPFITGATGWCPVYVLFEHRTNRRHSPR